MNIRTLAAAAALALTAAGAHAFTIPLDANGFGTVTNVIGTAEAAHDQKFTFSFGFPVEPSFIDVVVANLYSAAQGPIGNFSAVFGTCTPGTCLVETPVGNLTGPTTTVLGTPLNLSLQTLVTSSSGMNGDFYVRVMGDVIPGDVYSVNLQVTPVPEPGTYALMLAGLGVVGWMARRRGVAGRREELQAA